jgi:hypothetical protein
LSVINDVDDERFPISLDCKNVSKIKKENNISKTQYLQYTARRIDSTYIHTHIYQTHKL